MVQNHCGIVGARYLSTKSVKWVDGFHVSEVHYTYLTGEIKS